MNMHKLILTSIITLAAACSAVAQTITVTPGTLQKRVGTQATNLTLQGQINASDLYWLADNCPDLTTLDLADCEIIQYQGPSLKGTTCYPANTIPRMAFAGTRLENITFPTAQKTTIQQGAFTGSALKAVALENVDSIAMGAFAACGSLTVITLANGRMGTNAFESCPALAAAKLGGISELPAGTFRRCSALAQVTGTEKLCAIGDQAFASCTALTEFPFPASLQSIGASAFEASGLQSANLLPASNLAQIGARAFADCPELATVALPETSTALTLGAGVFFNDTQLTQINLPASLAEIPDRAFKGVTLDQTLTIPEGVTSIGNNALNSTKGTTNIVLPSTLISIGSGAMASMQGLQSINAGTLNQTPALGDNVWAGIDQHQVELTVPVGSIELYKTSPQWQDFRINDTVGKTDMAAEDLQSVQGRFVGMDLELRSPAVQISHVEIYNTNAQLLYSEQTNAHELTINTSAMQGKVFIINVTLAGQNTATLKLAR